MKKSKKLLLAGISAMSLVAVATGAVSTFAWFVATTTANVNSIANSENTLSTTAKTDVDGAFNVSVEITFSVSGSPVQVDNDGHEWVYLDGSHTQLKDMDATFRTGQGAPDRYFTVAQNPTVSITGNADALAAARGKSWSGVVKVYTADEGNTVSTRHALHTSTEEITGEGKDVAAVQYLKTVTDGIAITVSYSDSGVASATMSAFYVTVAGGTITWGANGAYSALAASTTDSVQDGVAGYLNVLSLS